MLGADAANPPPERDRADQAAPLPVLDELPSNRFSDSDHDLS
jgi:hypothetical protein